MEPIYSEGVIISTFATGSSIDIYLSLGGRSSGFDTSI